MLKPSLVVVPDHQNALPENALPEAPIPGPLAAMSGKEINRLSVVQQVLQRRMTRAKAGELLGIGVRQVGRLCAAYQREGAAGLVSRKRGRVGNRKLAAAVEAQVVEFASMFYRNCGPTRVREKLAERHGIKLAKETIRKILCRAGLWLPKDQRVTRTHPALGDTLPDQR